MKFQGAPRTIKIDEVLEPDEFQSIFGGKGTLIQPRPDNKPKSTVTVVEYVSLPPASLHKALMNVSFAAHTGRH